MTAIITARGLSFDLPNGRTILTSTDLALGPEPTALVGPNGIGKTTLARLLAGELLPTSGRIRRDLPVVFFAQRQIASSIRVRDFLNTAHVEPRHRSLQKHLLGSIDETALCTTLSGGEWMRVRLAQAITDGYLILDEPTNDLDASARQLVLEFLRQREQGFLLISHDRQALELCRHVLEFSNRGLSHYGNGYQAYVRERAAEREGLSHDLERAKRERDAVIQLRHQVLARQEKRNRRGAEQAKKGGQPKILSDAKRRQAQNSTAKLETTSIDKANVRIQSVHAALERIKVDNVMYGDVPSGELPNQKLIAEADGFNIRLGDRWLYKQDLTFAWRGPCRVSIKGDNGTGKTTLLKAVMGEHFETRGELRRGDVSVLYLDQKCAQLDDQQTLFGMVQRACSMPESAIRNRLAQFLFARETVFQPICELSGGERLRAALALGLMREDKPQLLVLDEPTNNLDLQNIEFLESVVGAFRGAVLAVSHDETFLRNARIEHELRIV